MFGQYFIEKTKELKADLKDRLNHHKAGKEKGAVATKPKKEYSLYTKFYEFLTDHLPTDYIVAPGKVRSKTHILSKTVDAIIYRNWCPRFVDMLEGWYFVDYIKGIVSIEPQLTKRSIQQHVQLTHAIKHLYTKSKNIIEETYIPIASVYIAYQNTTSLRTIKKNILDFIEEKGISYYLEPDIFILLDSAVIIKDWEAQTFKVIETKEDSLMWGYILLTEYLGLDQSVGFQGREWIKKTKEYEEF